MPTSPPPRRLSLLPPELEEIDFGWGEEQRAVVPSRPPAIGSRPPRPASSPPIGLDRSDEESEDRITSVPDEPKDEFARRVMAAANTERDVKTAPARPVQILEASTNPAPRPRAPGAAVAPQFDENVFEQPTLAGVRRLNPSEFPTAPPPADETARAPEPLPRTGSVRSFLLQTDLPLDPPPTNREPLSLLDRARRAVTPVVRPNVEEERAQAQLRGSARAPAAGGARFATAPPSPREATSEMKDRFAMGDFSGALEIAERILQDDPNRQEARSLAEKCREVLYDMYASRIDGMDRALRVVMGPDQIRWLSLDHRAGFLLSMVDGITTVDDLLDVSGMPRLDALRILCDLLDQKVVGLGR